MAHAEDSEDEGLPSENVAACGGSNFVKFQDTSNKGVWVPLTPPISLPKIFGTCSFTKTFSKIINLCTPPMVGEIS